MSAQPPTLLGKNIIDRLSNLNQRTARVPSNKDRGNQGFIKTNLGSMLPAQPPEPKPVLVKWLNEVGLDSSKFDILTSMRVEDEPEFFSYDDRQWHDQVAQTAHVAVIGESGMGKTMLCFMLERSNSGSQGSLFVAWKTYARLLEEKENFTVADVMLCLLQDMYDQLDRNENFKNFIRKPVLRESEWRQNLADLKHDLRVNGISTVAIGIDNLDHYPETWNKHDRVMSLLTALLRPEVLLDTQPWFLKLFILPSLYHKLENVLQSPVRFCPMNLTWRPEELIAALNGRLKPMLEKSGRISSIFELIVDDEFKLADCLSQYVQSPRAAIELLHKLITIRAERWKALNYNPEALKICKEDWQDVVVKQKSAVR